MLGIAKRKGVGPAAIKVDKSTKENIAQAIRFAIQPLIKKNAKAIAQMMQTEVK